MHSFGYSSKVPFLPAKILIRYRDYLEDVIKSNQLIFSCITLCTHIIEDIFPKVHGNKLESSYQRPGKVIKVSVTIVRIVTNRQACIVSRTVTEMIPKQNSTELKNCIVKLL